MRICGVIAEYNLFHNGHLHHLKMSRELAKADYCIVIMSGHFTQRGAPSIADKYARTRTALVSGADLVLELPSCYATGSAEYFAIGALSLLDQLGCVDALCFGSECGNLELLERFAEIFANEPPQFRQRLKEMLKHGSSYPLARSNALTELYPELSADVMTLSVPNNILGIEYLKALRLLHSTITPYTIKRLGADYHDRRFGKDFCSSSALRNSLISGRPFSDLRDQIPDGAYEVLREYFRTEKPIYMDDFSTLLHYKLILERSAGYTDYLDVTPDLSDRILNNLYRFTTISAFCELLKTKEMTYARISRCLSHILLGIRWETVRGYIDRLHYTPYARVLGFRRNSSELLTEIDRHSSIPLLTKLADAKSTLKEAAYHMFLKELEIADIYNSVQGNKSGHPMRNEYSTPLVII